MVHGVVATVVVGVDSGCSAGRGSGPRRRVAGTWSRREGIDIKEVAARGRRRATATSLRDSRCQPPHRAIPSELGAQVVAPADHLSTQLRQGCRPLSRVRTGRAARPAYSDVCRRCRSSRSAPPCCPGPACRCSCSSRATSCWRGPSPSARRTTAGSASRSSARVTRSAPTRCRTCTASAARPGSTRWRWPRARRHRRAPRRHRRAPVPPRRHRRRRPARRSPPGWSPGCPSPPVADDPERRGPRRAGAARAHRLPRRPGRGGRAGRGAAVRRRLPDRRADGARPGRPAAGARGRGCRAPGCAPCSPCCGARRPSSAGSGPCRPRPTRAAPR